LLGAESDSGSERRWEEALGIASGKALGRGWDKVSVDRSDGELERASDDPLEMPCRDLDRGTGWRRRLPAAALAVDTHLLRRVVVVRPSPWFHGLCPCPERWVAAVVGLAEERWRRVPAADVGSRGHGAFVLG